jgi:Domain of unknown function (DUF397)
MPDPTNIDWRTSSFCDAADHNAVEIKSVGNAFAVRDTTEPDGPILVFAAIAWRAFTAGVRAGEFDQ